MADRMKDRPRDDRRMHEGDKPGLVAGRGRERHEEPVRLDNAAPGEELVTPEGLRREQGEREPAARSAPGGHVAPRSDPAITFAEERERAS